MAKVIDPAAAGAPERRRHRGLWWLTIIVLVLGVAGFLWWRSRGNKARYITATVTRGNVQRAVSMTGSLNPIITVQVGSYVSGTVKSLACDFNTDVTPGMVCATIDPLPFQLVVDQDRAELGTAVAQLKKDQAALVYAKIAFERDSKLLAEGTVSQDTVDNDKSVYDQAAAQVGLDQASIVDKDAALKAAQVNVDYCKIMSPVYGTVITRSIDVGQTVASSLQTPTLFIIGKDLTHMQVDTNVSESDVGDVREGQAANFTVQAYPNRVFKGFVRQIRRGPITVQNVVTYDVVVAIDNPKRLLFPGMTADTHIVLDEHDNVLRVPLPAIRFTPEGIGHGRRGAGGGADFQAGGTSSPGDNSAAAGGGSATVESTTSAAPTPLTTSEGAPGTPPPGEAGAERHHGPRPGEPGFPGHHRPEGATGEGQRNAAGAGGEEGQHHHHRHDDATGAGAAGGQGGPGGPGGPGGQGGAAAGQPGHEQRPGGPRRTAGGDHRGHLWVLQPDGTLRSVAVTLGIDDGALIEVSGADLHVGDKVVVNEVSQEERRRNAQGGAGNQGPGQGQGQNALRQGGPRL